MLGSHLPQHCSIVESSHSVIPLAGGGGGPNKSGITPGCVPGWMEEVEPFREDASFWHGVWKCAGKPNRGDLHVAMARSKNQYHYAISLVQHLATILMILNLYLFIAFYL